MLHQGDRLRRGGGAEQGRYPFLETIAAAFDHRGARPQSCARSSGGAARARLVPVKTAPDPSAVVIGVTLPDAGANELATTAKPAMPSALRTGGRDVAQARLAL